MSNIVNYMSDECSLHMNVCIRVHMNVNTNERKYT